MITSSEKIYPKCLIVPTKTSLSTLTVAYYRK